MTGQPGPGPGRKLGHRGVDASGETTYKKVAALPVAGRGGVRGGPSAPGAHAGPRRLGACHGHALGTGLASPQGQAAARGPGEPSAPSPLAHLGGGNHSSPPPLPSPPSSLPAPQEAVLRGGSDGDPRARPSLGARTGPRPHAARLPASVGAPCASHADSTHCGVPLPRVQAGVGGSREPQGCATIAVVRVGASPAPRDDALPPGSPPPRPRHQRPRRAGRVAVRVRLLPLSTVFRARPCRGECLGFAPSRGRVTLLSGWPARRLSTRQLLRGRHLHLSGARASQGHAGSCAHLSPRRHCRSVPPRLPHPLPPPAVPRFLAPPHPRQPSSVLVAPGLVRGRRSLTAAVVCILPAPLGRGVSALEERGAVTGTWRGPSAEDRVRERRLQAAQQKPPPPALPAACSGRGCCGPESVPPQRHTWHVERSGESQATRVAGAAQGGRPLAQAARVG